MSKEKFDIEQLKKTNIHRVPDGYFDGLPLKIQMRLSKSKPAGFLYLNRMQWVTGLTAVMIVCLCGYYDWNRNDQSTVNEVELLADVSTEEVIAYLEAEEDISVHDIATYVEIEALLDELNEDHLEYINDDFSTDQLEYFYDDVDYSLESI